MDHVIELQLQKILNMISAGEGQENRALVRQTMRLTRALICLKRLFNNQPERND